MSNVYFIADTHFFHKGHMKDYPARPFAGPQEPEAYDVWLTEKWNSLIGDKDVVYIVGDFAFGTSPQVAHLLQVLKGEKHLIVGNQDRSGMEQTRFFKSITQIKDLTFRAGDFPFLREDFLLCLCHYPILSWNRKKEGACMIHGHCHGRMDAYNAHSEELRVDVGINALLSRSCGGFISLEELYTYFLSVSHGQFFGLYVQENKEY
ncbi:MAG: hypothetical protein LIP01_10855 [Tannerellaceae bacterium]|nr:hypothetical protein [Tannerellaceae bacterium]